jgi:hypothetical protein
VKGGDVKAARMASGASFAESPKSIAASRAAGMARKAPGALFKEADAIKSKPAYQSAKKAKAGNLSAKIKEALGTPGSSHRTGQNLKTEVAIRRSQAAREAKKATLGTFDPGSDHRSTATGKAIDRRSRKTGKRVAGKAFYGRTEKGGTLKPQPAAAKAKGFGKERSSKKKPFPGAAPLFGS